MELGKLTNVMLIKFSGQNGIPLSLFGVALKKFMTENFYGRSYKKCLVCMNVIFHRLIHACSHLKNEKLEHVMADDALKAFLGVNSADFVASLEEHFFAGLKDFLLNPSISFENVAIHRDDLVGFQDDWIPNWCQLSISELVTRNRQFLESRRKRIVGTLNMSKKELEVVRSLPPLIFVLDEAYDLMNDSNPKSQLVLEEGTETDPIQTDIYRVFRRTLRTFGFWWEVSLTVTISTDSHILNFYPAPTDDPSFRSGGILVEFLEPIFLHHTFDSLHSGPISADHKRGSWLDFMFSKERMIMIACCGRPLWAAHYGEYLKDIFGIDSLSDRKVSFNDIADHNFLEPISKLIKGGSESSKRGSIL
jgi:hypothetical protein